MYFVGYHEITHELLERMPDILLKNELSYTGVKGVVRNVGLKLFKLLLFNCLFHHLIHNVFMLRILSCCLYQI